MKRIYLDNAATTPMYKEVVEAMNKAPYGNPSSIHLDGRLAYYAVERARKSIAKIINAEPEQIIFTSGATESNRLAVSQAKRLFTSNIEHSSLHLTEPKIKTNRSGKITPEELEKVVWDSSRNNTDLVSIMMVNNEIGTIQPIQELCAIAHDEKMLFHTDATQAVGTIDVDVKQLNVDFLSFSAHKFHGPKGVGVLYVKNPNEFKSSKTSNQEHGLRAGTENVAGIVGMAKALEIRTAKNNSANYNAEDWNSVWTHKKNLFCACLPAEAEVFTTDCPTVPNIISVYFPKIYAIELVMLLDQYYGISCSTGSACKSDAKISEVLKAIYGDCDKAYKTIRFSMSDLTTDKEIKQAGKRIMLAYNRWKYPVVVHDMEPRGVFMNLKM